MNKEEILQSLDVNKIKYQVINHPPVYKAEEADKYITDL